MASSPALSRANRRWPAWQRVPPFLPVPLRRRAGGWTPQRQADFIGYLAETGSVAEAALRVGMSRMAAYRPRRHPDAGSLSHAWDAVMAAWQGEGTTPRMVTHEELVEHARKGPFTIRMVRGRFRLAWREPSSSALLRLLKHVKAVGNRRAGRRA